MINRDPQSSGKVTTEWEESVVGSILMFYLFFCAYLMDVGANRVLSMSKHTHLCMCLFIHAYFWGLKNHFL